MNLVGYYHSVVSFLIIRFWLVYHVYDVYNLPSSMRRKGAPDKLNQFNSGYFDEREA